MADQNDNQTPSWYDKMKDFLFAHKALHEVTGGGLPHPADMMSQDTSTVAKAAQEAGERMEAEKKAKAPKTTNRVAGPQ